ncbi:MAG: peptidylprolyl isomerase [Pirellulaceae bacterium]
MTHHCQQRGLQIIVVPAAVRVESLNTAETSRDRLARRVPRLLPVSMILVLLALFMNLPLAAQQLAPGPLPVADAMVAARVGGQAIRISRLQHELKQLQRTRKVRQEAQPALQAQLLAKVIDQLLILRHLEYAGQGAGTAEIDLAIENLQKRIQQQDQTLVEYLDARGLNLAELRQKVAWQIGWSRYLNRYLTDRNYQQYFEQHRREFDGTQLHVAHLLLKIKPAAPEQDVLRQRRAIEEIHQQITSSTLTFKEAVRKFSQGTTALEGGDLGWIQRHEPMSVEFSAAAFQLQQGSLSDPVRSPFGFHIIECREVKVGTRKWEQTRDPLKAAITRYLFRWTAQQQRERLRVEFTGAWPHFVPGTQTLATRPAPRKPKP